MKKSILASIVLLAFVSTTTIALGADEKDTYRSILKIRTYEYNSTNNTYSISQEGSAVAIGSGLLLTNAHVVFNAQT
jgi:S1-C subfamily serine protease